MLMTLIDDRPNHVTENVTELSEWIEQLDETAGAGRLFLITGAASSSSQEPQ